MGVAKAILLGSRPVTLLLGISPVLLGTALGYNNGHRLNSLALIAALLAVILMQSAANLINDVKDAETGVDSDSRVGPMRVVSSGYLSKEIASISYQIMLGGALLLGLGLAIYGGPMLILMAVLSCLAAYAYTGGPYPLSHYGLGELAALIFFGPVAILGSSYLQSLSWQHSDLLPAIGAGFLAAAVMAINNLRDRESDRLVGKRTLAVVAPRWLGTYLPWICIYSSLFCLLLDAIYRERGYIGLVLAALLWVFAVIKLRPLLAGEGDQLNLALKKTSLLMVAYCLLASLLVLLP